MTDKQDIHGGNPTAIAHKFGMTSVPEIVLDFSVNINPLGIPSNIERQILGFPDHIYADYPELYAEHAVAKLARQLKVDPQQLVVGNGSTEIFFWIVSALKPKKVGFAAPCYSGYEDACRAADVPFEYLISMMPENGFRVDDDCLPDNDVDVLFLASPNNPTGTVIERDILLKMVQEHLGTTFVVDESFVDFLPKPESQTLISSDLPNNLIVVRSLTKFFAIAGLRLGFAVASPTIINSLSAKRLPWSVNAFAQGIAGSLYGEESYITQSRSQICEIRNDFVDKLRKIAGIQVFDSHANFVLCRVETNDFNGEDLQKELLQKGILIRSCTDFVGLDNRYVRLAVKSRADNERLIAAITQVMTPGDAPVQSKPTMQPIMIVGTSSGAGKSLVNAAFCRYFQRQGVSVAPFKAQNMSLNSFVTLEGGEMGRAQVVQAKAAKIPPHTDMNPVLLKPTGDAGSQLIINGQPSCNVTARSYYEEKQHIRHEAFKAFDRLQERYDLIILEGAGSPAEINLQDKDFVNMAMAEYANAKTILVADIDPGGVFASIFGTIKLIPPKHRKLIKGIIINKFRGDVSLLDDGIKEIEALTGIPVLGVLPYAKDLQVEEEDSLGLDSRSRPVPIDIDGHHLDIAVIRLPRISNFTDFMVFDNLPGILLRYVSDPGKLGNPDLILVPGTKNTRSDMTFMHENGLAKAIVDAAARKTPVIGICGGFQMLGQTIEDPDGVEGECGSTPGLDLLPVRTALTNKKDLAQVHGQVATELPFLKKGTRFVGYEIHMGQTKVVDHQETTTPLSIDKRNEQPCQNQSGAASADGLVFGSYIHGIFDEKPVRDQLLGWLCHRKGLDHTFISKLAAFDPDQAFEQLADMIETYIDLGRFC